MGQGVSLDDPNLGSKLSKSDTLQKISFEASVNRGVQAVFKKQDDFVIWGPASVEIVDKEGDKISVEALGEALPQLLRRARLSLEHTDQIVGRILERFETEEPVEIEINGDRYERSEFPTDVLNLDDGEPAALYVAGEVFNDTQQSKRARERIQDGELTSYSISGEALVTRKKVEAGSVYDDILDIDLSAVTLCEEGMNQGAAYAKVEGELSGKDLAGEATDDDVSKREEVPVLDHPVTQGVGGQAGATSADDPQTATVSKNMSDTDSETSSKEKSEGGATIEDVLKRLPEDGELATKNDLEDVRKDAISAVEDQLPNGSLATVGATKSIVKDEVAEQLEQIDGGNSSQKSVGELYREADSPEEFETAFKQEYGSDMADVDAPDHDGNYGGSGDGETPADDYEQDAGGPDQAGDSAPEEAPANADNTTAGGQVPDQGQETQDGEISTTADKAEDSNMSNKQDPEPDVGGGGMGDSDSPGEPPHPDDYQTQEAWEADYQAWSEEYEEYASEEAEDLDEESDGDGDGDDGGTDKSEKADAREAAADLADEYDVQTGDVLDALDGLTDEDDEKMGEEYDEEDDEEGDEVEMGGGDYEDTDEEDEEDDMMRVLEESLPSDVFDVVQEYVGNDIARSDARKIARALEESADQGSEDDLSKTVESVLEGGAEVQGGSAIPTDPNDSQVDKQYSPASEDGSGEAEESPALSNFYN